MATHFIKTTQELAKSNTVTLKIFDGVTIIIFMKKCFDNLKSIYIYKRLRPGKKIRNRKKERAGQTFY